MKYFVIADTHFGHEKIIRYCNRPFRTVEEMDETLIKNWNETVSKKDTVLVLGDFALGTKEYIENITKKLNGNKILILGNHDERSEDFYRSIGFNTVFRFPILWNNFFLMSHAPLQLSETTPYFNFYGHVHTDEKYHDTATSKCVSVERIGYRPYFIFEK